MNYSIKTRDKQQDLSAQLRQWAIDAMKIPGLDGRTDLSYICRGQLANVWIYVMQNVVCQEKADLINANLRLHSRNKEGALSSSEQTLQRLRHAVAQKREETTSSEKRVSAQQAELRSLAKNTHSVSCSVNAYRQKVMLLTAHINQIQEEQAVIQKYCKMIQTWTNQRDDAKRRGKQELPLHAISSVGGDVSADLRPLLTEVIQLLRDLLHGDIPRADLQRRKSAAAHKIGLVMAVHGYRPVLNSLIQDIRTSLLGVEEATQTIDVLKDAERLRFSLVSSGVHDESTEPPLDLGVSNLIEQRQVEHQRRFLETEQIKVSTQHLHSRLTAADTKLSQRVSLTLNANPDLMALVSALLEKEKDLAEMQAVLDVTKKMCGTLKEQVSSTSSHIQALKEKHHMITDFRRSVQTRQSQICVLMRQNAEAYEKSETHRIALSNDISALVCLDLPTESLGSNSLKQIYDDEMRRFVELSLPSLKGSLCLNTTDLSSVSQPHLTSLQKHLMPSFLMRPACLIETISELRADLLKAKLRPSGVAEVSREAERVVFDTESDLPKLSEKTQQYVQTVKPMLAAGLNSALEAIKKAAKVKVIINHWWQQPALHLPLEEI